MSLGEQAAPCPVCLSNRGDARISPGPVIHLGRTWQVEHAYPCSLLGWLVIVLRRHAEAVHELTPVEALELGELQRAVACSLHEALECSKEYSVCYGEAENFSHLHVHVVPRSPDLLDGLRGGRIFQHLKQPEEACSPGEVARFCEKISGTIRAHLSGPHLGG